MPLSVIVGVMCVRVHALACVYVRKSTDLTCPSDPCCPTPGPSPQPAPPHKEETEKNTGTLLRKRLASQEEAMMRDPCVVAARMQARESISLRSRGRIR